MTPSSRPGFSVAPSRGPSASVLWALACLYTAQGIPFGFAVDYLPVVLREQGYSYTAIASLAWLQLPWQLKIFWAKVADHPVVRPRSRGILLALQLLLALTVAGFALRPLKASPALWFTLTALAAGLAATQDVFVDAFAVRALRKDQRGLGNTAQVGGYRVGMLLGGSALLLVVAKLGERATLLACAGIVAAASAAAFAGRDEVPLPGTLAPDADGAQLERAPEMRARSADAAPTSLLQMFAHVLRGETWRVLALALTFKLGLHMASALLKPMAVDFGWSKQRIGYVVVLFGSLGGLAGAAVGGVLHRKLGESNALRFALVLHAVGCLPLVAVERLGASTMLMTSAIGLEHFASGLGTTILFAALMTATRPADAGLHYTVLTSANALAIGVGGFLGGVVADHGGRLVAFLVATVVCLLPGVLLPSWTRAATASRGAAVSPRAARAPRLRRRRPRSTPYRSGAPPR